MPCYCVNNGIKQEVSDEWFDMLWKKLDGTTEDEDLTTSSEEPKANWRRQSDGYYNKKPNDADYFKKYYKEKTNKSCVCDVCGTELSCKSNLAKHKKSKKCRSFLI